MHAIAVLQQPSRVKVVWLHVRRGLLRRSAVGGRPRAIQHSRRQSHLFPSHLASAASPHARRLRSFSNQGMCHHFRPSARAPRRRGAHLFALKALVPYSAICRPVARVSPWPLSWQRTHACDCNFVLIHARAADNWKELTIHLCCPQPSATVQPAAHKKISTRRTA